MAKKEDKLIIDCSDGVGGGEHGQSMKKLIEEHFGTQVTLINSEESKNLNEGCGAEFVQKERNFPLNFPQELNVRAVALDGDADRNVFFYRGDSGFNLIDGDK